VRRFVALRRNLRLPLMFSALFHQSSHSGFGPIEFWTCFRSGVVHVHPEMVFVSTYFILLVLLKWLGVPLGKDRSSGDIALRALLTEAREAEGLTQEQLARRLNKPQSHVWKLENGERVLAYAEAPAYARALGLKFSEFSLRYAALLRMQTLPMRKWRKPKPDDDP
jgi:DNA-binding XRE family transcriptional regulator